VVDGQVVKSPWKTKNSYRANTDILFLTRGFQKDAVLFLHTILTKGPSKRAIPRQLYCVILSHLIQLPGGFSVHCNENQVRSVHILSKRFRTEPWLYFVSRFLPLILISHSPLPHLARSCNSHVYSLSLSLSLGVGD
jgi:hypothetical protein